MRKATIGIIVGTALAGTVLALGAGTASAAAPEIYVPQGLVGFDFTHDETVALAGSPVATSALNSVPRGLVGAVAPFTTPGPGVAPSSVLTDAAARPDGQIGIYLTNPAQWNGKNLYLSQGGTTTYDW